MIRSFRSHALRRYWETGDACELNPRHLGRIEQILTMLEEAITPDDMDLERLGFHKLDENLPRWSVAVDGNRCIAFSFEGRHAVDCEDRHRRGSE